MKIIPNFDLIDFPFTHEGLKIFVNALHRLYLNLSTAVNGNLGFGDGVNTDNVSGFWSNVVAPASPNTDFTITHNLGRPPVGYLVMRKDRACDVYTGSVPATNAQITLRATVANASLRLFILTLVLILPSLANAQGVPFHDMALYNNGNTVKVVPSANVSVCLGTVVTIPCTPAAQIFRDVGMTQQISNLQADFNGNFSFFAAAGSYIVVISGSGVQSFGYPITLPCIPGLSCATASQFPYQFLAFNPNLVLTTGGGNVTYNVGFVTANMTNITTIGTPHNGDWLGLVLQQDTIGGHTVSNGIFGPNFLIPPGFSVSTTANSITWMAWTYNSLTNFWNPAVVWGGPGGGSSFYSTVQSAGVPQTQRTNLNFLAPFTVADNVGNSSTDIGFPTLFYQTAQNNGTPLAQRPAFNCVPPLQCVDNSGNARTEVVCPTYISVGVSHAAGCMIDPGGGGAGTDYPGRDAQWHTSGSGTIVKPDVSTGIQYVAQKCNGGGACADSNDGLSWGSAKLTPYAALQALPNGATSPPTAGNGIVYVANDVNGIAYGGPIAGAHGGWWMFDSTDPGFAGGVSGFMRVPTVGSVTMECAAPQGSVIHQGGAICQEYWGGSTDNVHPAFWFATGSGKQVLRGFSFSNQATGGKIGIDSTNNRSGNTGASSVWLDRVQVNLGNCFDGVGAGPALDIGGASFWVNITHSSFSGCTTQDYTATAVRASNTVTLTLNTSATGDIVAGNNAFIVVRNMTDASFNGAYQIVTASGTSITYTQVGPNASTSGGQVFPYSASAIGINSGTGPGAGFVYVDDTAVNGGGIWAQGGFNGVGVSVKNLVYEGNGFPDMSPVEILNQVNGGDTFVEVNDVQVADNTVQICGVESLLSATFVTAQNATVCGNVPAVNNFSGSIASPLRQGAFGLYGSTVTNKRIAVNDDVVRRAFSPVAVRGANRVFDSSTWTIQAGQTLTNGILAPDGTSGATRVANTTGSTLAMNFAGYFGLTPQLGSYYLFGVWMRRAAGSVAAYALDLNFNMNSSGLGAGDYCQGSFYSGQGVSSMGANVSKPGIYGDGEWNWYSGVCKIITNPTGGNQRFDINIPGNVTLDFYGPVLTTIASGTMTDNEAWEAANNLQSYSFGGVAGDVAMLPGQRFLMTTPGNLFGIYHTGALTTFRTVSWGDISGTPGLFTGTITNAANVCASGTLGQITTVGCTGGGGGGSGTVDPGGQFALTYYNNSGTVAHVGPSAVPSLNGINLWMSTVTSGAPGVPTPALPGILGRISTGAGPSGDAAIVYTDRTFRVKHTNAGGTVVALPGAGTTNFGSSFCYKEKAIGNTATVTPATGTINGAVSLAVLQGQDALVCSYDNSNYEADPHDPPLVAGTNITLTRSDSGLTVSSTAGGGTVTHTGALTAGSLVKATAAADITNADLTGDCTTAGTVAVTCTGFAGVSVTGVNGNLLAFGASNTLTDSLIPKANVVTAAANFVSGELVQAAASTRATVSSGIQGANVVTSTANAAAAGQICGSSGANKQCLFQSLVDLTDTNYAVDSGTLNALVACPASNPATSVVAGTNAFVKPANANTITNPTLNFCTFTSGKFITKNGTTALAANDLITTEIAHFVYDGTNWQLQNPATGGGGGSSALSSVTAAISSNSIANGNNPQTWTSQQTTNTQNFLTLSEPGASTGGTVVSNLAQQTVLEIATFAGSTASPLSIAQGSVTNASVAYPALQVATQWNNASLPATAIVLAVTDTSSNAASLLINAMAGASATTPEFTVTKSGLAFLAGGLSSGGNIRSSSGTTSLTFQGGQDVLTAGSANGQGIFRGANNTASNANSAGGAAQLLGGAETASGTNALIGGSVTVAGGSVNTGTGTGITAGNVTVQGGACTAVASATTCPGVVKVNQVAFTSGTAVAGDLACASSVTAGMIASCSATGTGSFVGVIDSVTSNNVFITSLGVGGTHAFNAAVSTTFTTGHFVCQSQVAASGNLVIDNGTSLCTAGFGIGIYVGTTGVTTTPLVMMRPY